MPRNSTTLGDRVLSVLPTMSSLLYNIFNGFSYCKQGENLMKIYAEHNLTAKIFSYVKAFQ